MRDAVIVTAIRTPVGRAKKGNLRDTRPDDLAGFIIREAVERTPGLDVNRINDVLLGNAHPEGEAGYNMARIAAQIADLPETVAGATINRFCASGLQTMVQGAQAVMLGMSDVVLAGGSDCTSRVPMGGHNMAINKSLYRRNPGAYHTMGQTAEAVARKFGIHSRTARRLSRSAAISGRWRRKRRVSSTLTSSLYIRGSRTKRVIGTM